MNPHQAFGTVGVPLAERFNDVAVLLLVAFFTLIGYRLMVANMIFLWRNLK